ncbi:MAG TPA: NADH-ubiquinone oxidoreductase-F iron-sulfur binding region domain-containing protein [Acidimicrobiales bacterium]|nr:NADH-ubiquinone oxidoreductase-F iron-sulfur binding region domain-containing protein [Acidimicrobiales bacterium]
MTLLVPPAPVTPPVGPARLIAPDTGPSLGEHLARLGPLPRPTGDLPAMVTAAGVRGRGGAGFPTGTKLAEVAGAGESKYVVANGTEGEPLSAKDRALLTASPHLVLDGMVAAALAVRAGTAILCVSEGRPDVLAAVRRAVAERRDPVEVVVAAVPDRYVAGQETALVNWLSGGDAVPTSGPRPARRGVRGRPTLVDNVETLAHVGLVARFGAGWFRSLGLPEEPGTALVTVAGGVARPGVYEVPIGYPLGQLLARAGAGPVGALAVGGYFGTWIDPVRGLAAPLSDAGLGPLGARLGAGCLAVLPTDSCALAEVAAVADWFAASSAGQCGPCLFGLADLAAAVRWLLAGRPEGAPAADRWSAMVEGRGGCHLPDGAARWVRSALAVLGQEIEWHRAGGCGRPYRGYLPAPVPGGRA